VFGSVIFVLVVFELLDLARSSSSNPTSPKNHAAKHRLRTQKYHK